MAIVCLMWMAILGARVARAEVAQVDTSHLVFHESPTKTNMTVYSPSADLRVQPADWVQVRGGWEADIVSGASVAVKAGSVYQNQNRGADVVTAASVRDVRNVGRGGFTLIKDTVSLATQYSYSTENDYKSHTASVALRTEAYERNTQFELSYARNFDRVCDRVQSAFDPAVRYRALEDSGGCFSGDANRTSRGLAIDGFQASWSQAWTRIWLTQLVYSAQILHGFQSNPYRSVILGQGLKAQEHHPEDRARHALAVRSNLFIKPIRGALRLGARAYVDSWDIRSGTVEAEFEKYLGESLRVTARGRGYRQSGAVFWSDDYTGGNPPLGPRGQYWTGDRELSPFNSISGGLRVHYTVAPASGRFLGLMTELRLGASGDVVFFSYDEYTLGGTPVGNARAYLLGLTASALF